MENDTTHILEYLHILRRRKMTVLVSFFSVFAVVCLVNLLQRPIYRTGVELMVEKDQTRLVLGSNILTVNTMDDTYFLTQRRVLKSNLIAQHIVEKAEQDPENVDHLLKCFRIEQRKKDGTLSEQQKEALTASIQGSLDLESMPKTQIFRIIATGSDRKAVAYLANLAADVFVENNRQTELTNSQQILLTFTSKLQDLKDRFNLSQFALQKIQLELKLADMLKVYEDKHPEVIKTREQIENFSSYLRQQLEKVRQSLGNSETARAQRESVLFSYLSNDSARQGVGIEERKSLAMFLDQECATNKQLYNTFLMKLQELNVTGDRTANTQISILERAPIPSKPMRSRGLNLLFGCVVGLTLGVGLAFFQDYLDNTIKTSEDIKKYLDLMVLGIIPALEGETRKSNGGMDRNSGNPANRLMTMYDSHSPHSEAYRTMRTNILLASVDKPLRTLIVTSSVQKEGKSTTAINLAISIARAGSKVVLVDADLRRPILAKTFNNNGGMKTDLVDVLSGGIPLDGALYPSGVENLTILPCTKIPPNPSELLGSAKMKEIINVLKQKFELVIFDTPPLVAVTDAVALSTRVDGVVFIVSAGRVPRGICMQARASLGNAKANVLGAVLNNVQMGHSSYNYYHYYRYYNSYADPVATSTSEILVPR